MSRPLASRGLGWLAAGVSAAAILSGAAALALTAQRAPGPAIFLDLSQAEPAAAAVAAVADPAPAVVDEAPALDAPAAAAEAAPPPPGAEPAPDLPQAVALPATLPDLPVVADLALPPPETPVPEMVPEKPAEPKAEPEPRPEPKPEEPRQEPAPKRPAEAAPATTRAKVAAASAATATKAAVRAVAGGGVSPATYAKAVMKKVRATKKKRGAGRGAVTVGFTVAANGGLASVQVIRSSGNAALDQVGIDHIRRAAPFPAPPAQAGRSFSFEFVGR